MAIGPPAGAAGAVNWRSSVDPVDLTARLFRQLVQLIGAIVPPAGAVNWRSSVDPVDLTARLFRQLVQLIGAIVPPAGATHAVNWRSSGDPVDLGRALRSDIFRQLAPDRGGSVQINGSLVELVVNCRVSGHEIHQIEPYSTGLGSRSGRFKQWGGVRGLHVSLKEKARSKAGLIVGTVVLVVTCRDPFGRSIQYAFQLVRAGALVQQI